MAKIAIAVAREMRALPQARASYQMAKRVSDVVFALLLLIPLSLLVMLPVALLITLDSSGPAVIRQRRVGRNGKEFSMYKFRSMYHNVDDALHRKAVEQWMIGKRISDGPAHTAFKLEADPRITRVGKFIRTTSLDELPQLWNVLRGDMSIVGPRPPLTYEVERYDAQAMQRLSGKPGLTGTWQVYGRGRVPFNTMVEMDADYLSRQSILYDLKLIILTLPAVMRRSGAA
jgi:lipopolysaccharide/colanic/teichoic acid biosynthesis glycosyltransferase